MTKNKLDQRIDRLPKSVFVTLSQIDQLKGRWNGGVGLGVQMLDRLRQSALITSAGASTRIEGAQMSDDEVRALVNGLNITRLRERDKEEVQGYLDAARFIQDNFRDIELSENHLKQIHQILLGYSTKDVRHRGEYKRMPNDVVARDAQGREVGVVFKTMSPLETPMAMEKLFSWLNRALQRGDTHPLLIVAGFVVEFLSIHPFIDGNGRMSRLMTDLLMLKSGFSYVPYVSMERIIENDKAEYYVALRKSQQTLGTEVEDIRAWTKFFLNTCLLQAQEAERLISQDNLENVLSRSQYEVYQIAMELGEFAVRDIEARTEIPRPTIRQALERLEALGVVETRGAGRGARYVIKVKKFQKKTGGYPISANELVDEVVAASELEGMPLTEQDIKELRNIALGKVTTEDVRRRILTDIKRRREN